MKYGVADEVTSVAMAQYHHFLCGVPVPVDAFLGCIKWEGHGDVQHD